nr:hypothetical protein [Beihai hepe-like virus 4]
MEPASNVPGTTVTTAHPSSGVQVGNTRGDAGVYGPLTKVPVEDNKLFFKQRIGDLSMSPSVVPGTLLLSYVFSGVHDTITNQRLSKYLQYRYTDLKITAKRVDIAFGRSGSILAVPTRDPFAGMQQDNLTDALEEGLRAPASKTIASSDQIDFDMLSCFNDTKDPFGWHYLTTGNEVVPSNMTISCKIFILAQDVPQALNYSLPVYCEGTIAVRGYAMQIPRTLAFKRQIILEAAPELEFYPPTGDFAFRYHQLAEIEDTAGHLYVVDKTNHSVVIEDDEGHKEYHKVIISRGSAAVVENNLVAFLPTGLVSRTQIANPKYVRGLPATLNTILVTEMPSTPQPICHNGTPINNLPVGVVGVDMESQRRYAPEYVSRTAFAYANGIGDERRIPMKPTSDFMMVGDRQ